MEQINTVAQNNGYIMRDTIKTYENLKETKLTRSSGKN
jgi:hypothetical protein